MNETVRNYLIKSAKNRRPVPYSKIVMDCHLGLNLELIQDRNQLSTILGEIAAFEYGNQRPILSAIAMYQNLSDHGDGFYQICEDLGIGSKRQLKQEEYALTQMMLCFDYWSKPKDEDFFRLDELEFFANWSYILYDPNNQDHVRAKNFLLDTVWTKTAKWANLVAAMNNKYEVDARRYWSQRGWGEFDGVNRQATRVKPYTWAKLFFKGQKARDIFFTVGLSSQEFEFIIKLDFQKERDSKLNLNQIKICYEYLAENGPVALTIPFAENFTWDKLIKNTDSYIKDNEQKYIELFELVWGDTLTTAFLPRTNVNYEERNRKAKILGGIGEDIILKSERERILKGKFKNKFNEVIKVKDSYGFDIRSFDDEGYEIFIEVKTTSKGINEPFYMTKNEKIVSENNASKYYIYRVFDLDVTQIPPPYNLKTFCVEKNQMLFEPIQFEVTVKSNL